MLNKSYYLKRTSDYKYISRKGKSIKGFALVAIICAKEKLNNEIFTDNKPAFGITASKKIGNAVTRNLLKRRLKHILREMPNQDKFNNLAVSFCYRQVAAKLTAAEIKKDVEKILKKV